MNLLDLLHAPYFIGLFLAAAFLGWLVGGATGGAIGALLGAFLGLWFDFTELPWVVRCRLPVTIGMVGVLLVGFGFGWR